MTPSPSERTRTVERFPDGADEERKRKFAADLIAALDEVGVAPGDSFMVMSTEALDDIEAAHRDALDDAEERLEDARMEAREADAIFELVEDFERGVIDRDELTQRAREA